MQKFQNKLISLVNDKIITPKDAALIILAKDGLKPLSSIGVCFCTELISILDEYMIPYSFCDGRVHIGSMADSHSHDAGLMHHIHEGDIFGFPVCCSSNYKISAKKTCRSSPFIFHIPCSENCIKTVQLEKKYSCHIRQNYPIFAQHIEQCS